MSPSLRFTVFLGALCSPLFLFAQYPTIPDSVKVRGAQEESRWQVCDDKAWQEAAPFVMQEMLQGRPFVPWAHALTDLPQASLLAFPGAEGGGRYSRGGRGGHIYVVNSLADEGAGTLREACEAGGARIVVFNVAGEIRLKRPIHIRAPYITIAGQTAPGQGVVITGETVAVDTHDVILRYLRFRRGSMDVAHRDDAAGGNGIGNIIYDHCSATWGLDEVMSMYRHVYARDSTGHGQKLPTCHITIQDCIFAEGLDLYNHAFGASIGGHHSLFTRNLFANNISRNPSVAMDGDFNFVNNVLYNWWNRSIDGGDNLSSYNIIANYFKPGPVTGFDTQQDLTAYLKRYARNRKRYGYGHSEYATANEGATSAPAICYRILKPEHGRSKGAQHLWGRAYVAGNVVEGFPTVTADNWKGGVQPADIHGYDSVCLLLREANAFAYDAPQTVFTAEQAYEYVLQHVGATKPCRDAVDARIIEGVRKGTVTTVKDAQPHESPYSHRRLPADSYRLGIITDPQQVGGLPSYTGTPYTDADADGIPDAWETLHGLDPHNPNDASTIRDDGYMTIEWYINSL